VGEKRSPACAVTEERLFESHNLFPSGCGCLWLDPVKSLANQFAPRPRLRSPHLAVRGCILSSFPSESIRDRSSLPSDSTRHTAVLLESSSMASSLALALTLALTSVWGALTCRVCTGKTARKAEYVGSQDHPSRLPLLCPHIVHRFYILK
jgi:hypothetical protein